VANNFIVEIWFSETVKIGGETQCNLVKTVLLILVIQFKGVEYNIELSLKIIIS